MIDAVEAAGVVARVGFTFRRTPGIAAARQVIESGELGRPLYINAQYWTDYGSDPQAPMSWRYRGGPGSGALADLGSHLADTAEFLLGPVESVTGAALTTVIAERPLPLGHVVGHAHVEVSDQREPVRERRLGQLLGPLRRRCHRRPERVAHRVRPPEHAEVRGLLRARRGRVRREPRRRVRRSPSEHGRRLPPGRRRRRPPLHRRRPGHGRDRHRHRAQRQLRLPGPRVPRRGRRPRRAAAQRLVRRRRATPCCWRRRSSAPPRRTPRPRSDPLDPERRPRCRTKGCSTSSKLVTAAAAGLLLTVTACSSQGGAQNAPAAAGGGSASGGPSFTIAMVTHEAPGSTFWDRIRAGAEQAAEQHGIELKYSNDPDSASRPR